MAKKKPISRIVIAGAGIGVLLIVIVPVMIFAFGVGIGDVLPQDTDPAPFEIPICQEGKILSSDGICIDVIIPIIEDPELFCTTEPEELQKIADCELLTRDESIVPANQDLTVDECSQVNRVDVEQCNAQIDKLIEDWLLQIEPIEQPIPPNQTSIDDPFTQICDQDPSLIICGDSRSLEILTRVLKTDSAGIQTVVETAFNIPLASLFAENTTNIDFRTGQLQFEVQVKGDPDFRYMGTGMVDLLIGDQSLFLNPLEVKVDGIADEEGKVDLLFVSPTGATSDLLLFDFEDNFDKFINEQTTTLRLNVIELNIAGERDQDFAIIDQDLFTMDIFRDDIQILITDEEGIESRVYPSDSRIIINPRTSKSEPALTGVTRVQTFDSIFYGNGRGCSQFRLISDQSFTPSTETTATVPAPTITSTVLDDEGNVVTSGSGRLDYSTLTRNQNYTAKVNQLTSSPLDYGKSQETKSYICTQEGKPDTKSYRTQAGSTKICGYYTLTSGVTLSGTFTITPNSLACNFPQETP